VPEKQSNSSRETLALCIIARDEGEHLRRCLESVASIVDAIYITDTGSTDDTCKIAGEFTDRIRRFPWRDDFSAARNASIADVSEDWILTLDADDYFPDGEAAKIRPALDESAQAAFTVRYEIMPGHTPEPGLKLFRNRLGVAYEGFIHESIRNSLAQVESGGIGHIDAQLVHAGYRETDLERKISRNLPLLKREFIRADEVGDRMQRLSVGVDFANAEAATGALAESETRLQKLIEDLLVHGLPGDGRWELSPLVHLLWMLFEQARHDEAAHLCDRCESLFGKHPYFPLYRGMARLRAAQFDAALSDFKRFEANTAASKMLFSVPVIYLGCELWSMAGQCCLSLGDAAQAVAYFTRALAADPANPEYAIKLKLARIRAPSASSDPPQEPALSD
jgi:glycosyltransferase involved in cell wall biosynthesis